MEAKAGWVEEQSRNAVAVEKPWRLGWERDWRDGWGEGEIKTGVRRSGRPVREEVKPSFCSRCSVHSFSSESTCAEREVDLWVLLLVWNIEMIHFNLN